MRENLRGLSPHGGFARREEVRKRLIGFNVQHLAVELREGSFFSAVTVIAKVRHSQGGLFSDRRARGRDKAGLPLPWHMTHPMPAAACLSAPNLTSAEAPPARQTAMSIPTAKCNGFIFIS